MCGKVSFRNNMEFKVTECDLLRSCNITSSQLFSVISLRIIIRIICIIEHKLVVDESFTNPDASPFKTFLVYLCFSTLQHT